MRREVFLGRETHLDGSSRITLSILEPANENDALRQTDNAIGREDKRPRSLNIARE
jgi:hypothetical protein